jgi:DNA polymerase III delta prime subunit
LKRLRLKTERKGGFWGAFFEKARSMNLTWVDKYRPTEVKNIKTHGNIINLLTKMRKDNSIPHLLCYGPSGCGKTTIMTAFANDLCNKKNINDINDINVINVKNDGQIEQIEQNHEQIDKQTDEQIDEKNSEQAGEQMNEHTQNQKMAFSTDMRIMKINASDKRGIIIIREKIMSFIKSRIHENIIVGETIIQDQSIKKLEKIVIMDEADYMTTDAQYAICNIMDTYKNVLFIFICNYIRKIIPRLQSRCQLLHFSVLPMLYVRQIVDNVIDKENIKISPEGIRALCRLSKFDLRTILYTLQSLSHKGNKITPTDVYDYIQYPRNMHIDHLFTFTELLDIYNYLVVLICERGIEIKNIINEIYNRVLSRDPLGLPRVLGVSVQFQQCHLLKNTDESADDNTNDGDNDGDNDRENDGDNDGDNDGNNDGNNDGDNDGENDDNKNEEDTNDGEKNDEENTDGNDGNSGKKIKISKETKFQFIRNIAELERRLTYEYSITLQIGAIASIIYQIITEN